MKFVLKNGCSLPAIFIVIIVLSLAFGWVMNLYKLTQLDFDSSKSTYKAEVFRAIGLAPPIGAFMGWITFDEERGIPTIHVN